MRKMSRVYIDKVYSNLIFILHVYLTWPCTLVRVHLGGTPGWVIEVFRKWSRFPNSYSLYTAEKLFYNSIPLPWEHTHTLVPLIDIPYSMITLVPSWHQLHLNSWVNLTIRCKFSISKCQLVMSHTTVEYPCRRVIHMSVFVHVWDNYGLGTSIHRRVVMTKLTICQYWKATRSVQNWYYQYCTAPINWRLHT